jgi:putative ABC transport system substrate-binding protein
VPRSNQGAKPADLPVEQSTKIESVINLRRAKMLGGMVPPVLSGRADEMIESFDRVLLCMSRD